MQELLEQWELEYADVYPDGISASEHDKLLAFAQWLDTFGLTLDGADSRIHGAEKIYETKSMIENLENALINGYKTLGDTDIGDLLLMCEAKEGAE